WSWACPRSPAAPPRKGNKHDRLLVRSSAFRRLRVKPPEGGTTNQDRRGPRMSRATIDLGIDLGTTNSCIGLLKGNEVEILRNNDGQECTPSAVWIDRRDRLHVGQRAKEQYEADEENACIEFKLQMGKSTERTFQRGGRKLKPEELSAEVLKSLLSDAR